MVCTHNLTVVSTVTIQNKRQNSKILTRCRSFGKYLRMALQTNELRSIVWGGRSTERRARNVPSALWAYSHSYKYSTHRQSSTTTHDAPRQLIMYSKHAKTHHCTPELATGCRTGPQKICWIFFWQSTVIFVSNHNVPANSLLILLRWRFVAIRWCHSVTLLHERTHRSKLSYSCW